MCRPHQSSFLELLHAGPRSLNANPWKELIVGLRSAFSSRFTVGQPTYIKRTEGNKLKAVIIKYTSSRSWITYKTKLSIAQPLPNRQDGYTQPLNWDARVDLWYALLRQISDWSVYTAGKTVDIDQIFMFGGACNHPRSQLNLTYKSAWPMLYCTIPNFTVIGNSVTHTARKKLNLTVFLTSVFCGGAT